MPSAILSPVFFSKAKHIWLLVFFGLLAASPVFANVTTVVKPNGGECLTTGETYTIEFSWSGSGVEHVALYYRTDGSQPTHLDSSVIKHPINVPQQGTTYGWKPTSSHISETGRIWIDGHESGHTSLSTWDSSNANFSVRSSCVAAAPAAAAAAVPAATLRTPVAPSGFEKPARVVEAIPGISSSRLRFESPWEKGEYRIRLLEARNGDFRNIALKDVALEKGDIVEFKEENLKQNTLYETKRFIQAYDFVKGFESAFSEITPPFWTLIEEPKKMEVLNLRETSVTLKISDPQPIPNFFEGRTQVFFENLTLREEENEGRSLPAGATSSSGWISLETWTATGLEPETQYQFWAKFRNGQGVETPFGSLTVVKTLPAPVKEITPQPIAAVKPEMEGVKPVSPPPKPATEAQKTVVPEREAEKERVVKAQLEEVKSRIAFIEQTLERLIAEREREKRELARQPPPEKVIERVIPRALLEKEKAPPQKEIARRSPRTFVVFIENNTFNPNVLEIQTGDTVRWINKSDQPFWPASDPHPTHTGLSSFDALGDILRGESYRYIFRKTGVWPYHNHTQAKAEEEAAAGAIIVNP